MKPTLNLWNFSAKNEIWFSILMTLCFLYGCLAWLYFLGGWTITLHRNGKPFIVLKEWW